MNEVDGVVVELKADIGDYEAKIERATKLFEDSTKRIEDKATKLNTSVTKAYANLGTEITKQDGKLRKINSLYTRGAGQANAYGAAIQGVTGRIRALNLAGLGAKDHAHISH